MRLRLAALVVILGCALPAFGATPTKVGTPQFRSVTTSGTTVAITAALTTTLHDGISVFCVSQTNADTLSVTDNLGQTYTPEASTKHSNASAGTSQWFRLLDSSAGSVT